MRTGAPFTKRRKSLIITGIAVAAAASVAAAIIPAFAAGHGHARHGTDHAGHADQAVVTQSGTLTGTGSGGTILVASLRGADEVPVAGGPAVGDRDGAALEFVRVKADKVSVAVTWRGTVRPTLLHIHQGPRAPTEGSRSTSASCWRGASRATPSSEP